MSFYQVDQYEIGPFLIGKFGNFLNLLLLSCFAITSFEVSFIKLTLIDLEGLVDELVDAEQ